MPVNNAIDFDALFDDPLLSTYVNAAYEAEKEQPSLENEQPNLEKDLEDLFNDPAMNDYINRAFEEAIEDGEPEKEQKQPTPDEENEKEPSMMMVNNVLVTNPKIIDSFFKTPLHFSEDDVSNFRNVSFDVKQSGHAYARQACHTMKMLYMVNQVYKVPLHELVYLCGSEESHKCQAMVKAGQCSQKAVTGFFFCGRHRKLFSHQEGAGLMNKRRMGVEEAPDNENKKARVE